MDTRTLKQSFEWLPYLGPKLRDDRLKQEAAIEYREQIQAEIQWIKMLAGAPYDKRLYQKRDAKYWQKWRNTVPNQDEIRKEARDYIVRLPNYPGLYQSKTGTAKPVEEIIDAIPNKKPTMLGEESPMESLSTTRKTVMPSIPVEVMEKRIDAMYEHWNKRITNLGHKYNWDITNLSGKDLEDVFLNLIGQVGDVKGFGAANDPEVTLVFYVTSPRRIVPCLQKDCDSSNSLICVVNPKNDWQARGILNYENAFRIARWFDVALTPATDEEWTATFMHEKSCRWTSKDPCEAVLKALLRARILEIQTTLSSPPLPSQPDELSSVDLVPIH